MRVLLFLSLFTPFVFSASPPGDVVGKVTVGFQGWFSTSEDGSPGIDNHPAWWHYSNDHTSQPNPSNTVIKSWPDTRDYAKTYATGHPNLGNGQQATLFSSFDDQTLEAQIQSMTSNGIDAVALQRFNPMSGEGPIRDAITEKLRGASERMGIKFYIMYDVSDWHNVQNDIRTDWLNKMKRHTDSPAYARQNGKPVVCIWGFGFNDPQRPFTPDQALDVINWFKNEQGVYLIGGVPTWWHRSNGAWDGDVRDGFFPRVFSQFNMVSPWMVGRIGTLDEIDMYYRDFQTADQQWCNENGVDYQPCALPGDLLAGHRRHGDFMWRQFYNFKRLGVQGIYISMFDEYNESNQIAKTAESQEWIPQGSNFKTLDEDGTRCTSDYYLRLTGDGSRMLKGNLDLTEQRPTNPWP